MKALRASLFWLPATGYRLLEVRPPQRLGDAGGFLLPLDLDRLHTRHLDGAIADLLDGHQFRPHPHALADVDGGDEAHAVQAVVDTHPPAELHLHAGGALTAEVRDERERQVAVTYRAAE